MVKDSKKVILLTQNKDFVPHVLREFYYITYEPSNLKSKLTDTLKDVTKGTLRFIIRQGRTYSDPRGLWSKYGFYKLELSGTAVGHNGFDGHLKVYKIHSDGSQDVAFERGIGIELGKDRKLEEFSPLKYELKLERIVDGTVTFLLTETDTTS